MLLIIVYDIVHSIKNKEDITVGDILMSVVFVFISWIGFLIILINELDNNWKFVIYHKKEDDNELR